ncbi:hypothetical protein [Pseudomonas gessardii]|uniref:Uncharacterized protein n=1 Tax=Pseudomonas gessardii TaxID=78544 RepID=A0ABS9EZ16_9PSED|nr:hypothetical protein [Pseudomonas gessardii]MCF4977069.1 hypothetical protein [Pseudomonas gessardii]MCF4989639.1 hypothetical protein [Pseudomonas gessardii]MCF5083050.1 hypothetical protein [Pseudomonas gessardii]MCF5095295.1 hypothetical protein [Pseudomonas gessardii]MCF5105443.1 hypothetical protein [Pseudomonas gessardii]
MSDSRKTNEESLQAAALLAILAQGNREIEAGNFQDMEQVFGELDQDQPTEQCMNKNAPKR